MRTFPILFTASLLACTASAFAQQMYKCGSTYSQTPCGPDASVKAMSSGAAPDGAPGASGYDLCAMSARSFHAGPEPETARIQPAGARTSEVIQYAGKPMASFRYDLTIDSKNSAGIYSGARAYSCWLSEDQRRVLQFGPTRR